MHRQTSELHEASALCTKKLRKVNSVFTQIYLH